MSDRGRGQPRGGRGGFRGDRGGGGFRGDRGGGGSFRGDRGGGGGFRGDRGGGGFRGDRGGGGFRGDRGGGGGFRGDRGGGGYRGDRGGGGGYRGDRGGGGGGYRGDRGRGGSFRGGRADPFEGQPMTYGPSRPPAPDANITQQEDKVLQDLKLESGMGQLQVSTTRDSTEFMPLRPAFGNKGKPVILWANYFVLRTKPKSWYKYSLEVKVGAAVSGPRPGPGAPSGPKGRKLQNIVRLAMVQAGDGVSFVSEYKSQVISLDHLKLPDDKTIRVWYPGQEQGGREYAVEFHGPNTPDLDDLLTYVNTMRTNSTSFPVYEELVDVLGVILGHTARTNNPMATVGTNKHFPLNAESEGLGGPAFNIIARGFFQSVRPATGRLLLNVNVAHGIFRFSGPATELIDKVNLEKKPFIQNMRDLNKALSRLGAKVKMLVDNSQSTSTPSKKGKGKSTAAPSSGSGPKHYIKETMICGLADRNDGSRDWRVIVPDLGAHPDNVRFTVKESTLGIAAGTYSVAEYYKLRYGYDARKGYPVINIGTKTKPIYVPAELVEVLPGQLLRRKANPEETRGIINFACRSPYLNATSIAEGGRACLGLDDNATLNTFGVTVEKNLLTVVGRELIAPGILYTNPKNVKQPLKAVTREGSWNMASVKVATPGKPIGKWTWVSLFLSGDRYYNPAQVAGAMTQMVDKWREMGISIPGPPGHAGGIQVEIPYNAPNKAKAVQEALESTFKNFPAEVQFVFVVLQDRDTPTYNAVKLVADTQFGYHTVCAVRSKLVKENGKDQYFANIGLKVNLKAGGVNHKLDGGVTLVKDGKTMVVGYDVTHPTNMSGNTDNIPSLVGMVASIDPYLAQWPATAWTQASKLEMLDATLESRFEDRLALWSRHNGGRMPENVIIYRDGVSESQFMAVLDKELPLIRRACEKRSKSKIKIALIVSVKRHQTRFFPTDENNMTRSRNIKNGTVVDRGVTQARVWDFFLTAHTALQGTARPAHYTVLLDEIFRSTYSAEAANVLEKVTHDMCYLFGRATKAVSICPPAYYADILCTRQRVHMSELFEDSDASSVATTAMSTITGRSVHQNLRDSMYYI